MSHPKVASKVLDLLNDFRPHYVLYADGIHDDAQALKAWAEGGDVRWASTGEKVGPNLDYHTFYVAAPFSANCAGRTLSFCHNTLVLGYDSGDVLIRVAHDDGRVILHHPDGSTTHEGSA